MYTTSLKVSKKIKEMGVEVDSRFKSCGGHTWYDDEHEDVEFEECPESALLGDDEYCESAGMTCEFLIPRYLLSELPQVLKKIGDIKGWRHTCPDCGDWKYDGRLYAICSNCPTRKYPIEDWLYYFLEICKLIADGEEKEADDYLFNLL